MKHRAMRFLKRLFHKSRPTEETAELTAIARIIGPLLDNLANAIVRDYLEVLLEKPIVYIVPAVWGADKDGELDAVQKEIHKLILPVVENTFQTLDIKGMTPDQTFAVSFLIRGFLIGKVTFMIETARNHNLLSNKTDQEAIKNLKNIEPAGRA